MHPGARARRGNGRGDRTAGGLRGLEGTLAHRSDIAGLLIRLTLLFALAAVVRVGWVLGRYGNEVASSALSYPDEEAYWRAAESMAAGDGLIDEFGFRTTYMPGYPAFLSLFAGLPSPWLWARVVQALLAALVAPAASLLADHVVERADRTLGLSTRDRWAVPWLSGVIVAMDPFLVFFSGLFLTEALFASTLVTAWYLLISGGQRPRVWSRSAGAGFLLLAGIMLRPSSAVLLAVVPIAVVLQEGWRRQTLRRIGIILLVVVAGLFPWAMRNWTMTGHWCWLTTRGGISLYDGLRPQATGASDLAHTKQHVDLIRQGEWAWNAHYKQVAWKAAWEDPLRVLWLAGVKLLRTWSLTPNVAAFQGGPVAWLSAIWMSMLLGTAGVGIWRWRSARSALVQVLLPVLAFTLLHMVFVGSVRYRVPIIPMVAVVSAVGWAHVVLSRIAPPAPHWRPGGSWNHSSTRI